MLLSTNRAAALLSTWAPPGPSCHFSQDGLVAYGPFPEPTRHPKSLLPQPLPPHSLISLQLLYLFPKQCLELE